jgi:hypothetical protein
MWNVSGKGLIHLSKVRCCLHYIQDMQPVAVVVMDGEELPISICLTQHRLAHQLGSSLLLQEDPVLDPLMLAVRPAILLYSLLKAFSTLRSVEESLAIRLDIQKHSLIAEGALLMVDMLME